ncbi:heterokaryon incompatibility protein-domain-containing protein [Nemania serpens]|nr:heterokaryon incompatibility protein-domain-containing protein [Nemania serpens]
MPLASMGPQGSQMIKLGDKEYWLMPVTDATRRHQDRAQRSELQRFDSEALNKVPEYKYKKLPSADKRIRLLQLRSGTTHGPEIFCELVQADYDNAFHIPTQLDGGGGRGAHVEKPPKGEPRYKTEKEKAEELVKNWEDVEAKKIEYEALSWCWGTDPEDYVLKIEENGKTYKKRVRKELALALKYLRLPYQTRTLWIDAICINQDDHEERNHQVQMMSRVYTRAKEVCIWLGEDTDESKTAIDFIHSEIMELKNFDTLCSDKSYTEKWQALMMLMQRDWFSRRWVVQEIALATKACIYCGPDSIPWKEFAVAVELFVEVETASHRLSEIMQKDEKFRHIPNWFEHVSELGASLLVQATGKVFRAQRTPMQDDPEDIPKEEDRKKYERYLRNYNKELKKQMLEFKTIDPLDRRSLLSLEYLVSTMFIFQATEPRDVIYSLLAIARDAAPFARASSLKNQDGSFLAVSLLNAFLEEKPFVVDYNRPYADVCRDFVEFCIRRKHKLDPAQALDILCRPWALDPQPGKSIRINSDSNDSGGKKHRIFPQRKEDSWKKRDAKYVDRDDGDSPKKQQWKIVYGDNWTEDKRTTRDYIEEIKTKVEWKEHPDWIVPLGWARIKTRYFGEKEEDKNKNRGADIDTDSDTDDNTNGVPKTDDPHESENELLKLPSWVNRASKAPFNLYHHAGQPIYKTGRAAADPLVGHPQDGHRNYSAAQTRPLDLKVLKFRRRPQLGHYSLYVKGFVLDEVKIVKDASQGGNIPKAWLDLAGWEAPYSYDPPDKFWRTLVGDRGRDNRNPPYYYARACKESVHKGGIASNSVNTSSLIDHERNSIVAEYCRRVQSVIWGRRLFETKSGRLGLAPDDVQKGDKVCILYGCTVPVILRRHEKKDKDIKAEVEEDRVEHLKALIRKWEQNCLRRATYRPKKELYQKEGEWDKMMDAKAKAEKALEHDAERPKITSSSSSSDDPSYSQETPSSTKDSAGESETHHSQEEPHPPVPRGPKRTKTALQQNKEDAKKDSDGCYYEFVGESYLHGMMDGEALRERFYQDFPDRTFELR